MSESDTEEQPNAAPAYSNHVSIKMPQFMSSSVSGWFQILEAQFHLKSIKSEETKFFHLIAALPPDLISKLPAAQLQNQKYSEIKDAVIATHEKTKPELFDKLISKTKLTGRPSHYLQELNSIAAKVGVGDDLIRHRFIDSLPPNISPVLATQKTLTLQQLGTLADEISPFLENQAFHVKTSTSKNTNSSYHKNTSSNTPKRNTNHPGLQPFSEDQRQKICRGHIFFAEKSRTCKPWCRWPNKKKCEIQPNSRAPSPTPSQESSNSRSGSP